MITIIFTKNVCQAATKIIATQCFLTENTKTRIKQNSKRIAERPHQILADYVHISWKVVQLLRLFLFAEVFRISGFI